LLIYFAALAVSAIFSADPRTSAFKLATQAYLLAIPVLAYNLAATAADLRRAFQSYVAGASLVALLGVATLLLFPIFGHQSFLAWSLHNFGMLPTGPYPRLELSFEYPALLANYLGLALMLVILMVQFGWLSGRAGLVLGGAMLVTALFALTPGLGGIVAMLGFWLWHRRRATLLGTAALAAAIFLVALEVVIAAVTPIVHGTEPYWIYLPGVGRRLAPAIRLLAWSDALRTWIAHPLVGVGIGVDPVRTAFESPRGDFGFVTDAHNMFLSIAAQAGIVGLLAMLGILGFSLRQMFRGGEAVSGLALALLSGMAVHGLVGSFEDSRHLWLAYGLMLAAARACGSKKIGVASRSPASAFSSSGDRCERPESVSVRPRCRSFAPQ
jgi:O-antigen ligase